jgi:hypothetical protein
MVASMKRAVFWVAVLCNLVEVYQHFRGAPSSGLIALMMEAARTSETLVTIYQTTWHYNPEDSHVVTISGSRTRRLNTTNTKAHQWT